MDARNDWHAASIFSWLGVDLDHALSSSNLLPILVLALGIDDSLHRTASLQGRERFRKVCTTEVGTITVRVGRAIMLTSLTTMAAFSQISFDIAALRSFGIEAALGVLAAFFSNRNLGTVSKSII